MIISGFFFAASPCKNISPAFICFPEKGQFTLNWLPLPHNASFDSLRPNPHRMQDVTHNVMRTNSNVFPFMLLACSVDTPIHINRSHLLASRCASRHVLCGLGLRLPPRHPRLTLSPFLLRTALHCQFSITDTALGLYTLRSLKVPSLTLDVT